VEGVIEAGAANAETIQAALEKLGFEGAPTEIAGKVAEAYEATEKYGGAFWDAAGGDFTTVTDMGMNMGAMFAINQTFGKAFQNTAQENLGYQIGAYGGMAVAGPFGAIAGGMMGAIVGISVGKILGLDTKPDYDFVTRAGDGGFEGGKYITTPFGNFGFNAGSTRDLSMTKQGSQMLDVYAKALIPMDVAMASVMTKEEVGEIKGYISDSVTENSHTYTHDNLLKTFTKQRLEAINATMSDQRKIDTGFGEMINEWNDNLAGGYDAETYSSDPNYAPMKALFSKRGQVSRVSYNNDVGVTYGAEEGDYIIRDSKPNQWGGGETQTTYNLSQAIRDGEFSSFEQEAMERALSKHSQYSEDTSLMATRYKTSLSGYLNQAMAENISKDQQYAI